MTEVELDQIIVDWCDEAGKEKEVSFGYPSRGSHIGGEWERDWRMSDSRNGFTVSLTYWRDSIFTESAGVFLPLVYMPYTQEQRAAFIDTVKMKIDEIRERVGRCA